MTQPYLRLHTPPQVSFANGPGKRLVLWLQGCTLACPGCFNPATHAAFPVIAYSPSDWIFDLASFTGDGITISGGEPLQQVNELSHFLRLCKDAYELPVLVFSGYSLQEIEADPHKRSILKMIDVLVAGRYQNHRTSHAPLLGSLNQTIYFLSNRIQPYELTSVPDGELLVMADGSVKVSGIHIPEISS